MRFFDDFTLSNAEWSALEEKFGALLSFQSWQLLRMNAKNNHTDEFEDVSQMQRLAMYRAGCYHKRQVYIQSCLKAAIEHVSDPLVADVVRELVHLWDNKTRHGAGKVKYGDYQQDLLDKIVLGHVPAECRPDRNSPLEIDATFAKYFKAITWNSKKTLGKKITREKSWRSGLTSLSEHDHLAIA